MKMYEMGRSGLERREIKLDSGRVLHELHNGEDRTYGLFEVLPDGRTKRWMQFWQDEYRAPRGVPLYPGPISMMRAILRGEA